MTLSVATLTMARPCCHGYPKDTLMIIYGNHRDTVMMLSVAIVTKGLPCCLDNYRDRYIIAIATIEIILYFYNSYEVALLP